MKIIGIEEITYRVEDMELCRRFFTDWGLTVTESNSEFSCFETLNGGLVKLVLSNQENQSLGLESGPTLLEVVWGVADVEALQYFSKQLEDCKEYHFSGHKVSCFDPSGLKIGVQVSSKRSIPVSSAQFNTWEHRPRVDSPAPIYEKAVPIEIGHAVLFVNQRQTMVDFYCTKLGFCLSDQYPNRGSFLRCAPEGGHHDLFLLELPSGKNGLNHVAFTVRDIHEVIGGGMNMDRLGWKTELGPGRHPISSAYFWYFENPAGGLIEYYADEDELTSAWQPRDFEPGPTRFAEWAVSGGIDGNTRRPKGNETPKTGFITDKAKP